jgi:hypothetical protein
MLAKCDVSGPDDVPDGKIGIYDLSYIGKMFGSSDSIADFTGSMGVPDGIVDIYELATIRRNFGRIL